MPRHWSKASKTLRLLGDKDDIVLRLGDLKWCLRYKCPWCSDISGDFIAIKIWMSLVSRYRRNMWKREPFSIFYWFYCWSYVYGLVQPQIVIQGTDCVLNYAIKQVFFYPAALITKCQEIVANELTQSSRQTVKWNFVES